MPMVYMPGPLELVLFKGKYGILIPDPLNEGDRKLSIVFIQEDGTVEKPDEYKWNDPDFFSEASPEGLQGKSKEFVVAFNAIKNSHS